MLASVEEQPPPRKRPAELYRVPAGGSRADEIIDALLKLPKGRDRGRLTLRC